ncbi:MAG: hypothetical protein RLP02_09660, partial [Coleofasciculus sp. C2-GNP5-27]
GLGSLDVFGKLLHYLAKIDGDYSVLSLYPTYYSQLNPVDGLPDRETPAMIKLFLILNTVSFS